MSTRNWINKLRWMYRHFFPEISPRFTAVSRIEDVLDLPDRNIVLARLSFKWGDLGDPRSLVLLCRLAASGYGPVFEFGTFRGRTTYNLAMNLACDKDFVATLDVGNADDSASNIENHSYAPHVPGELIFSAPPEIQARIRLLHGDSLTFDYSPYEHSCGLVFIDAGHSYEAVNNDSLIAFKLIKPTGGVIVWDDYGEYWPGVKRALDELAKTKNLTFVRSDGVVMCIVPPILV